jgi:hypothetical protein
MLSVLFSGSVACMDAGKEREHGRGSFAPTKKSSIVMYRTYGMLVLHDCMDAGGRATQGVKAEEQKPAVLRKIFAVKQMDLKSVQSNE